MLEKTKKITINIPLIVLKQLSKIREKEGISVSFQLTQGAKQYLKIKGKLK